MKFCKNCLKRKHKAIGLCNPCYQYFNRTGKQRPDDQFLYRKKNGEGCLRKDGYRVLQINKKRILEHTYIMEIFLNRKLFKNENVHHKNGIRHDNRIENLELWSNSQPSGQKIQEKVKWIKEFIKNYPEFFIKN